jgi:hypothetical protein
MKEAYIINDYCIIREGRLVLNGERLFMGNEDSPAALFASIYRNFNLGYAKFFKMDNLCKLGFLACEFLMRDKDLSRLYPGNEVGLVLSNAGSSIDTDRNHQRTIANREDYFPSPSVFVYTLANIVIGEICIRYKLSGESIFLIEKNFNPERIVNYVSQLLDDQLAKSCITGWVEMNGDHYEAVLYFVQKSAGHKEGIAIFDPGKLSEIYMQRI